MSVGLFIVSPDQGPAAVKDDWETAIEEAVEEQGVGDPEYVDISGENGIIINRGIGGAKGWFALPGPAAESNISVEGAGKTSIKSLDDFLSNPKAVGDATSDQWYQYFKENGFNPEPLSGGTHKGVSYSDGGGYIIRWGGDRAFEYHPGGLNHHGGVPYYRISSGQTGKQWFDLNGNPIPRK